MPGSISLAVKGSQLPLSANGAWCIIKARRLYKRKKLTTFVLFDRRSKKIKIFCNASAILSRWQNPLNSVGASYSEDDLVTSLFLPIFDHSAGVERRLADVEIMTAQLMHEDMKRKDNLKKIRKAPRPIYAPLYVAYLNILVIGLLGRDILRKGHKWILYRTSVRSLSSVHPIKQDFNDLRSFCTHQINSFVWCEWCIVCLAG